MKSILRFASIALSAMMLICAVGSALAQSYPNKPIRFIVPFPPGFAADALARIIGQKLAESWAQPVVIDNRTGAGGLIGTEMAAKAPPDGYTIFLGGSSTLAINPSLYGKVSFDPERDFAPVSLASKYSLILVVHPSVPAKSVKELIALAKSKPGQLNFASTGNGTTVHLAGELFKSMASVNMVHIPYKGAAAVTDLIGGRVSLMFASMPPVLSHVKAGKLRGLAVTGASRSSAVPDLPTIAESGIPGYKAEAWFGVFVPAETSKEIVTKLNTEIVKILQMPDVENRLANQGFESVSNTPEQFATYLKAEIEKWSKIVKDSGVRID